jgi:hypothetical protein
MRRYVPCQVAESRGGLLQAKARNDIAILQVKGGLYVDEVISANGNVKLIAPSGNLLEADKNATAVDKGDTIVDQWANIFVPYFNDVVVGVENGNLAAYKRSSQPGCQPECGGYRTRYGHSGT